MYYIFPELRIGDCRFRSGKGARPLYREHRGSRGEQRGSSEGTAGSKREHYGAVQGRSIRSLNWPPRARL